MDISKTSIADLIKQSNLIGAQIAGLEASQAVISAELSRRYAEQLRGIYARENKQHGSVKLLTPEGAEVRGEVDKKVKWDSAKLMEVARGMGWEEVQRVFKIKFEVPEKIYKSLGEDLKEKVDAARSTTYGEMKISASIKGD